MNRRNTRYELKKSLFEAILCRDLELLNSFSAKRRLKTFCFETKAMFC